MPVFSVASLETIACRILESAGVPKHDADIVSKELSEANAVGHDSHGVMRLMQYIQMIDDGYVRLGAKIETVRSGGAFTILDANFNFGQVAATVAVEQGLELARKAGTSTVMIRNCNHVGRLGSYSQKAAERGFTSTMAVNAPGPGGVAPFGGIERRLGTNPISMSAPWGDTSLVLDMTTSASAEGKVRVALQKGEQVPEGWLIDSQGNPTTDPQKFYDGGALLPLGGPLGFKGSGMSVMIDVFGGMLSGSGICRTDLPRGANGVWMYFVDVAQFIDRDEYDALMEKYVDSLKGCRKQPGVEEILLPGEIERRRDAQRRAEGVPVPDETWRQISDLAERLGADISGQEI
ncbi:MAG: Ldh family oxidoreductase [Planctomycetota bacterium]|nr:Ldh family oxidoreductase [Planctomycetota bacterium]